MITLILYEGLCCPQIHIIHTKKNAHTLVLNGINRTRLTSCRRMTLNLTHTFTRTRQQETDLPAGTAYSEEIEQYINLLFGFDRQRFPGARFPPLCNRLHAPTPRVVSSIRNIRRMFAYGVEGNGCLGKKGGEEKVEIPLPFLCTRYKCTRWNGKLERILPPNCSCGCGNAPSLGGFGLQRGGFTETQWGRVYPAR